MAFANSELSGEKNKKFSEEKLFRLLSSEMSAIRENALIQYFSRGKKGNLKNLFRMHFYDGFEEMISFIANESSFPDKTLLKKSVKTGFRHAFLGNVTSIFHKIKKSETLNAAKRIECEVEKMVRANLKEISQTIKHPEKRSSMMAQYSEDLQMLSQFAVYQKHSPQNQNPKNTLPLAA